jgi:hypothetical protein
MSNINPQPSFLVDRREKSRKNIDVSLIEKRGEEVIINRST